MRVPPPLPATTLRRTVGVLLLLPLLAILVPACGAPGSERAEATQSLAEPFEVLLLGDSISLGYTAHVRAALEGRAHVSRAMKASGERAENCAGTNHGLVNVERWVTRENGGWDVIHFNFGLHDLKRVDPETNKNSNDPAHPQQASPERYAEQLAAIVDVLERTGARLVFATTTPVPTGGVRPHREPADVELYNDLAREVMAARGIAIDDLYAFVLPQIATLQKPVDVHFTSEGSEALGNEVAASILRAAGLN